MSENLNVKNIASDLSLTKKSFLDNFFKNQFIKNMNNFTWEVKNHDKVFHHNLLYNMKKIMDMLDVMQLV